jgi:trk system potassium uptake protein TrkA
MFVIIVGGGNTGAALTRLLLDAGHSVKIIESRPTLLDKLVKEFPNDVIYKGDGSSPSVLEKAGIRDALVLAAVTRDDETNLVVTSLARFEFNVPRTIARVNNPKNAWLFTAEMGVDVGLNQADILAHLIAEEMSLGDMMTLLKLKRGEYSLVEEKVFPTAPAANKAIRDLKLPQECTIVAVIRNHQLIIPHGSTVLEPADEVLALVNGKQLGELASILAPPKPVTRDTVQ